jgi:hypothetical protein
VKIDTHHIDYLEKEVLVVKRFVIAAMSARPISPLCTAPLRIRPMDPDALDSAPLVMSHRATVYLWRKEGRMRGRVAREVRGDVRGWMRRGSREIEERERRWRVVKEKRGKHRGWAGKNDR